jgi:GTP cyclohydrolase II
LSSLQVAEHTLNVAMLQQVTVRVYQDGDQEAIVLIHGDPQPDDRIPVRIQSACAYGEILGSLDCDCRDQLDETMRILQKERRGILIYLNQEGRGAGLFQKARAYSVQQAGHKDTVDAYRSLGLPVDTRTYSLAGAVLKDLNILQVSLYTNNPRKIRALRRARVDVEPQPLVLVTSNNSDYVRTKQRKLGHLISEFTDTLSVTGTVARSL